MAAGIASGMAPPTPNNKCPMPDEETPLVPPEMEDAKASSSRVTEASLSSWIRLLLFFLASCVSGGIVSGQNVYSRLFCEAGLFSYACRQEDGSDEVVDTGMSDAPTGGACCSAQWLLLANTLNILSVSMAFFFLLGGLVFDALGGRRAAVLGCAINAGGFAVLALLFVVLGGSGGPPSLIGPIAETALFCIAVLLVDAGSLITNVSFFGFLWHLPKQQALILALSNSCMNVSAFVPLILRSILDGGSLSLSAVLLLYVATIAGLALPLCWWSVPGIDEYRGRAMEVLGLPIPRRTIKGMRDATKMIQAAKRILARHTHLHWRTIVVGTLAWMAPFIYMTMADPMGEQIFAATTRTAAGEDRSSGERLATMFNQVNGVLGLVLGPILGIIVDRCAHPEDGILGLGVMILSCLAVIALLSPIAVWSVQLIDIFCAVVCQIAFLLFITRYSIIFAPPNRTGSVTGVFVCGLGLLSLIPIIGMSIGISINGSYIRPQVVISSVGVLLWAAYLWFAKKADPWPSSPALLPEDERDIAKNFGVGSIEDAAFVAGKSTREFRRLSASSNVMDQRDLIDTALSSEAPVRVMEVARRRSSLTLGTSVPKGDGTPHYPIEDNMSAGDGTIERGAAETSLETTIVAFNGHGGFGGKAEPSLQYCFAPVGPPDDPRRITLTKSIFSPMLSCAQTYGTVLEMRVVNEDGKVVTAAVCTAFHPGSLEEGSVMKTGSDRYYCSLVSSGALPVYMDREFCGGDKALRRFAALKQDSQWDKRREEQGRMWYVGCLGTHPSYQGKGYARRLLNIIAIWAERDGVECYLECSAENVPFYEKCGYRVVWKMDINVVGEDSGTSLCGMALGCRVRRNSFNM